MQNKLNIPIILGTTRPERKSADVARLVLKVSESFEEINAFIVDPLDFNMPFDGNDPAVKDPKYTTITFEADAFFIVTPEYNHSFPGSLKRLLDSELENYIHKPVAFAGVSSGKWGGIRAIEALVQSVREMGMVSIFTDVYFPNVQELFDLNKKLLDEKYIESIKRVFTELIWMTKTLKYGREEFLSRYHSKV